MQIDVISCIFGAVVIVPLCYGSLLFSYKIYHYVKWHICRWWIIQTKWAKHKNGKQIEKALSSLWKLRWEINGKTQEEKYLQRELSDIYNSFSNVKDVLIGRTDINDYVEAQKKRHQNFIKYYDEEMWDSIEGAQ